MKFLSTLFCLFVTVFSLSVSHVLSFAQPDISVKLFEKEIPFDQPPVLDGGRTLVPVRGIFEYMGASVTWNPESRSIDISLDDTKLSLTLDSTLATVNDTQMTLDVAPKILNNRTLVPLRFVIEQLGLHVEWIPALRQISLTDPAGMFFESIEHTMQNFEANKSQSPFPALHLLQNLSTRLKDTPVEIKTNLNPSLQIETDLLAENSEIVDLIDLIQIDSTIKTHPSDQKTEINTKLQIGEDELSTFFIRTEPKETTLALPSILDQYFSFSSETDSLDLNPVFQIAPLLSQLSTSNITAIDTSIGPELGDEYANTLKNILSNPLFKAPSDTSINLGGRKLPVTKITLSLTPEDLTSILNLLSEKAMADDALHELLYDVIVRSTFNSNQTIPALQSLSKEDFSFMVNDLISNLTFMLTPVDFSTEISIFVNESGHIVCTDVSLQASDEETSSSTLNIRFEAWSSRNLTEERKISVTYDEKSIGQTTAKDRMQFVFHQESRPNSLKNGVVDGMISLKLEVVDNYRTELIAYLDAHTKSVLDSKNNTASFLIDKGTLSFVTRTEFIDFAGNIETELLETLKLNINKLFYQLKLNALKSDLLLDLDMDLMDPSTFETASFKASMDSALKATEDPNHIDSLLLLKASLDSTDLRLDSSLSIKEEMKFSENLNFTEIPSEKIISVFGSEDEMFSEKMNLIINGLMSRIAEIAEKYNLSEITNRLTVE